MKETAKEWKYIYGVVSNPNGMATSAIGLTKGSSKTYLVCFRDVAAIVCERSPVDYTTLRREEAIRELAHHQQVIEEVMERCPVLPMKFGTMVEDETKVETVLRQAYAEIKTALAHMQNRVQIEVVVTWDLPSVFRELSSEASIVALKAKIDNDPSPATLADRIKLGEMVKKALDGKRGKLQQEILWFLGDGTLDLQINPLFDDSLVLNLAVLIETSRQAELNLRLRELDQRLEGKLNFRCVGPLPPYSFNTIEVQSVGYEDIEQARKLLNLGPEASLEEIKRAYYRQARKHHPDAQGNDSLGDEPFAKAKEASRLLTAFCQTQLKGGEADSASATDGRCSFTPEAVAQTIIVTLTRSQGQPSE